MFPFPEKYSTEQKKKKKQKQKPTPDVFSRLDSDCSEGFIGLDMMCVFL